MKVTARIATACVAIWFTSWRTADAGPILVDFLHFDVGAYDANVAYGDQLTLTTEVVPPYLELLAGIINAGASDEGSTVSTVSYSSTASQAILQATTELRHSGLEGATAASSYEIRFTALENATFDLSASFGQTGSNKLFQNVYLYDYMTTEYAVIDFQQSSQAVDQEFQLGGQAGDFDNFLLVASGVQFGAGHYQGSLVANHYYGLVVQHSIADSDEFYGLPLNETPATAQGAWNLTITGTGTGPQPVPEPSSLALLATGGLIGALRLRRRGAVQSHVV
jgi:hypothetical protein